MAITALPPAPSRATDTPALFSSKMDALLNALATFVSEANTTETNVNAKEASATTSAGTATTQAGLAAASATTAAATTGAAAWNAGTAYTLNQCAISQINFQTYRRKVAGTTATDPANDATNWTRVQTALYNVKNAVAASAIDVGLGDFFTKTIAGITTFTVTGVPAAGLAASFVLDLTNGGAFAITWWAGMKWASGVAPLFTASGRDVLGFFTHDGGTTWTGMMLAKDVK